MSNKLTGIVSWDNDLHFRGHNTKDNWADFDSRPMDEPGDGPTPMEMVLQAAGACTGMDTISILKKKRLDPQKLEITLEGTKRSEHPRIFTDIHLTFRAGGGTVTLADLERAAELSINNYCSVLGMLKATVNITWECHVD